MHFSTSSAIALALPLLPGALAGGTGAMGFSLGAVTASGCKQTSDYEADFDAIATSGSKLVRIYAASQCNSAQNILPAAKAKGFQVILGVWPDTDESLNADKAALQQWVPQFQDQVYAVTVGSETLYRGNFTGPQLLEKINDVKSVLPKGIKMGTADSYNKFADGTADAVLTGGVDIILANAFSYWQGSPIDNATHTFFDDLQRAITHVQAVTNSLTAVEVMAGETGWPTDGGSNYEAATAGTQNAANYYQSGFCGLLKWGVGAFYFEAFDEPWKPNSVGTNGDAEIETVWGAFDVNRKPKFTVTCN